jgi:TolB protein
MKKLNFLFFYFLACALFSNEQINVELPTQKQLTPIYLEKIKGNNNDNADLFNILDYDLKNSAYFSVYEKDNTNIVYLAKVTIEKNEFNIDIISKENSIIKYSKKIEITNNLSKDRQQIHQICDEIIKTIFNKTGIATSKVLFCLRKEKKEKDKTLFFSDIWICDYDGENAKQITFDNSYCIHPIFVPTKRDNKKYIYTSYKTGQPKLYLSSIENNNAMELISLRGNQLLPAISLNSDKIAFISDAAGRPDLFVQYVSKNGYLKGKPIQIFSLPRATQASPTFSPDGEKVAFVSDKDGPPRIYILQIPEYGKIKKRPTAYLLTKKNRHNVTPCFSPDGKKLAFSAKVGKVFQIWVYDFIKGTERQLTFCEKSKENPVWGRDSLHIIYNTEDINSSELYIIDIKNKKPVKISKGLGKKRFPSMEIEKES